VSPEARGWNEQNGWKSEQIVGDAEANALQRREQRESYEIEA
jgi:hypothetical protein